MSWTPLETSTYQDHVIKHVLGATVLGWLAIGDALHLVLDVGLLWTIYVNAEMNLMALAVAIDDLEGDEIGHAEVLQLQDEAQRLIAEGREVHDLARFDAAPLDCPVVEVELFGSDAKKRIIIRGEAGEIEIETSNEPDHFSINCFGGSLRS
ncbi:MAG TPA: hypothetical protein VE863_05800 [Pyrinomonadaceae bacterium]|jgi:hypothetical protein|nr:hypothetical protein [Pyrinomonadaceae bacterium]